MPWYLTTKRGRKGYIRELLRLDEALSRHDPRGLGSPQTRIRSGEGFGYVLGILLVLVAFLVGLLSPKPDSSLSEIVITREGGLFVQFNGAMHPVSNLASARLIVGKAADAKVISASTLSSMPAGEPMGIPNGPQTLVPRTDDDAVWSVCDWRDTAVPLSLVKAGDITTAVIAGTDLLDRGTDLGDSRAILVKSANDRDKLWLIYRDTRAEIGRDDYAAQAALGLTPAVIDAAITVSSSLLTAIGTSPVLTAPKLADQGTPSTKVTGSNVGDVLTVTTTSGGRTFYLVGKTGVQQVSPVLAQMMVNTGSAQRLVDDPASVQAQPRVKLVDDGRFPSSVPTLVTDSAICWNWAKTRGDLVARASIFTKPRMPLTQSGRTAAVTLVPNNGSTDQATATVTRPGAGFYARVVGNGDDSVAQEQLVWVDPTGWRYPIDAVVSSNSSGGVSFDPTVKALGFDSLTPTPIPWAVARLYTPGPSLSIKNAQVKTGSIVAERQTPFAPTNQGRPAQATPPADASADPSAAPSSGAPKP
ncbi:Type VII secretion system protein eccB1 (plasmid) [Tsukamurella tyrosinosolvens]|uniref:Type VII secretion protein EccB n=1 Tax=Tsukamurella tyrosinosolvens TaxID=57704 RepID=A0A1H4UI36_TSUTY|nr:type VII secretion protein EccB [Tsukamurella tyrosinosolvens]KXO92910.1 type VII secretion protein [Tsukamurella tyrosinosolvens]SEC68446.1 type VII secretion protein EccB [Tsukamurella tyrosinosolvens]VEH94247.1 Type VII secretion system protein eccB1 [Tsukamurella tyrosinosolvens]